METEDNLKEFDRKLSLDSTDFSWEDDLSGDVKHIDCICRIKDREKYRNYNIFVLQIHDFQVGIEDPENVYCIGIASSVLSAFGRIRKAQIFPNKCPQIVLAKTVSSKVNFNRFDEEFFEMFKDYKLDVPHIPLKLYRVPDEDFIEMVENFVNMFVLGFNPVPREYVFTN